MTLKVTSDAVDLADLLTFVTSTTPPAAHGTLALDTAFDLPRGDGDVLHRLAMNETFHASQLRFTSHDTQGQIDTLSRAGQGKPKDLSIDDVASRVEGAFILASGVLTFKNLVFDVRGAQIRMAGSYALESRAMTEPRRPGAAHGQRVADANRVQVVGAEALRPAPAEQGGRHAPRRPRTRHG